MSPGDGARVVVGVHLHDDGDALRRSLPTAVHQRFAGQIDVIVVDDGASDEARRALAELSSWYANVTVHRHETRLGRAAARNRILELASDATVAWMDLGDVWHPRKVAVQHAALLATEAADTTLVACTHRLVDLGAGSEELVEPDASGDVLARAVSRRLGVPGGTLLGTADAFKLVGRFDQTLPHRDDEELLLRFLASGGRFIVPPGGPLLTGSSARSHPTAREAAVAERRIRRRHRATLRAEGATEERRAHRRELERIARLHTKDGRRARAVLYRRRADLTAALGRIIGGSGTTDRRPATGEDEGPETIAATRPPTAPDPPRPPGCEPVHRLAEAQDWAAALATWSELPAAVRRDADPLTYEVVARCHRALGDHDAGIAAAEAGLATWPGHPRIEIELAKNRAATVDWSEAILPSGSTPAADEAAGLVASLGNLTGRDGLVTGHVTGAGGPLPTEVTLLVNDQPVVTSYARAADPADPERPRDFSLSCEQLLEFLGDGDRIAVVAGDRQLPIDGFGAAAQVRTGYPSRMGALRDRLDGGAVFTKFGRLRPGYTPARKRRTLELVDEVAQVVADAHGYTCTPFYGNLLGAVREQDFIAHDVGGFDLGYISGHSDPASVRAEFADLCRRLLDLGYHLELERYGVMIRRDPADQVFVDLNYAWSTSEGELRLAYGWRHAPAAHAARLQAPRDTYLGARLVPVPADAEAVLHQVYGPGWATPDQGFDLAHRLRRDERFLLDAGDLERLREAAPDRVEVLTPRD